MIKNAIILCSGGIDSVTTAYYVKHRLNYNNILILFFNYNQRNVLSERKASRKCSEYLNADFIEINLRELGKISTSLINSIKKVNRLSRKDLKDTKEESDKYYVPQRNVIFLAYAIALAESYNIKNKQDYNIFVGFKCEGKESYPDSTKKFIKQMNKLKSIASIINGKIYAPLINKDKEDIILLGKKLGVDFKETFSCYAPIKNKPCGYCLSCMLRKEGFYWAGIKDPTIYYVEN
ncbi:MAG: 7-cyano-7-deazaguanine synthase [Nanoarchaeota archaeon]|nr:7-cyano-7-deazaguanine synthase [Nanoarchaeota archaeon]